LDKLRLAWTALMCAEEDPITAGAAGAVLKWNY
jgi:hypothetical protein